MQIKYKDVLLRDYRESDIDDEVRWNTVDTQWGLWDAPWEKEDYFRTFDPEAYRQRRLDWLRTKAPKGEELRWFLEIDTAQGVHIGTVSAYLMTEDFQWREHGPDEAPGPDTPVALGLAVCNSAYWSSGWGTKALTAWVRYWLDRGCQELYTQTWSGNTRMIGLANKLGFVEYLRKPGIRQVRGGTYDGLTFRLDVERWERLSVYLPKVEDFWFRQAMEADPDTMAYNAGWEVNFSGYHPDTGCIDLPPKGWQAEHDRLVGHEPEQFYGYLQRGMDGAFVGEVNFQPAGPDVWSMGVLLYAPFRGKGYGHKALELLLERAFVTDKVPMLQNSFEEGREAAMAIHLAAGFRQVGTERSRRFGREVEVSILELTREEYLARRYQILPVDEPDERAAIAADILADLPDWFGLPDSTAEYVQTSRDLPFWAARQGGEDLGFLALKQTGPRAAELYVMGVRPAYHHLGLGRKLFEAAYQYARERGYAFLQVKTVQEGHYPEYDRTCAFYRSLGFTELECLPTLWDSWNPCQIFIMSVT